VATRARAALAAYGPLAAPADATGAPGPAGAPADPTPAAG
jgi:hypothetical protein